MSLLGRIFNTVNNDVFHPIGRVFSGQPAPPPQRPQSPPRVNTQQLANALQVHAVNNPTFNQAAPTPPPLPLAVHVAAPPPLHIGSNVVLPSLTARTSPPALNQTLQQLHNLHPPAAPLSLNNIIHLGQGVASGVAQLGLSAEQAIPSSVKRVLGGNVKPAPTPKQIVPSGIGKVLLGSQAITPIQNEYKQNRAAGVGAIPALGIAGLETIGDVPIIPGGKGSKIVDNLVKSKTSKEVSTILKQAGVHPEVVKTIAPSLVKANTPEDVTAILKTMPPDFLAPTTKNIPVKGIQPVDRQAAEILNISPTKVRNLRLQENPLPEQNQVVNEALSKMPPPQPSLPPTPPHTGDLVPMQHVPTVNKLFSNKVNVLRRINTPSSHALADRLVAADQTKEALRADYMARIPTVQKLNDKETTQMFDVVEKKLAPKNVSPKVQQAVKEWQNLTPTIHQNAFEQGAIIGNRKNYVPHSYPSSFWTKQSGSKYDAAIQHLMDKNQIDHQQAVSIFRDLARQNAERPTWFGNFENARLTDLPGYHKSKDSLYKYIEGAANRTAEAYHFGLDNQITNKLLQNIRMEGGDVTAAIKAMEHYLRPGDTGMGAKGLRGVRGVFGAARLGTAAISHMGQTSNVAVDTGVTRTIKSWGKFLAHNPAHKDFIEKTGVINPQVLHGYQNQYTSVKGALSRVTAPGLNQVMKVNRSVTALAYRDYGNFLAKTGKVDELRKLGVTGDIGKILTPEQEIQAARGGVNRTMFSPSRATTPTYAETPLGKTVGQYRTAYAYKQTGFIYDRVLKEAAKGNLKPLARYLTVSAGVGAATIQAKKEISGSKEGPGGKALDVAAALGGIPGELATELARYGSRGGVSGAAAVGGAVAPLAGEAINTYDNVTQALHGKPKAAERYLLGLTGPFGGRLSKSLVPAKSTPISKQPPNNTTTTINAKGKTVKMTQRQLKATNPDELARWEGMTAKARGNVRINNPDKYIRDQQALVQKELAQGKTTQAFKDNKTISQTQIYKNFDKNIVQAYGLNAADFKAFVTQATPDQISQLQNLDAQLVDKGLVSSTKFTKALYKATGIGTKAKISSGGSSVSKRSSGGKAKVATLKLRLPPKPRKVRIGKAPSLKARPVGFKAPTLAKPRKVKVRLG